MPFSESTTPGQLTAIPFTFCSKGLNFSTICATNSSALLAVVGNLSFIFIAPLFSIKANLIKVPPISYTKYICLHPFMSLLFIVIR